MDLQQLVIRPFSPAHDLAGVLTLYAETAEADHAVTAIREAEFRQQLELAGHDPLKDRWVIPLPGDATKMVASVMIRVAPGGQIAEASIVVHPAWRQRGLGSQLLIKIFGRAYELQVSTVQIYAPANHPAASHFMQKHGFMPQGAYTELRLDHSTRLPPVIWPYGYSLRPFSEIQDVALVTEAMNLSYIPLWGHHKVSTEEMASWLPNFNSGGLFLVFSEKGRVVGISRTEPSPERTVKNGVPTGYIDAPGVVPQHRRLDLYRALVLTGIRLLYDQGVVLVEMESWGDKLEVLKMYRELGFKDLRQLVCYHKPVGLEGKPL